MRPDDIRYHTLLPVVVQQALMHAAHIEPNLPVTCSHERTRAVEQVTARAIQQHPHLFRHYDVPRSQWRTLHVEKTTV